jgi:hypothetical protein
MAASSLPRRYWAPDAKTTLAETMRKTMRKTSRAFGSGVPDPARLDLWLLYERSRPSPEPVRRRTA